MFSLTATLLLIFLDTPQSNATPNAMQSEILRSFTYRGEPVPPKLLDKFLGWISDPSETNVVLAVDLYSAFQADNEMFGEVTVEGDRVTVVDDGVRCSYRVLRSEGNEVTVAFFKNTGGTLTTADILRLAVVPGTVIRNDSRRETVRLELLEAVSDRDKVEAMLDETGERPEPTQADLTQQAVKDYQRVDDDLNQVYGFLKDQLKNDPQTWAKVLEAQRAWLKYRELMADAASAYCEGGSMHSMIQAGVLQQLTEAQIRQLRDILEMN